VLSYLYIYLLTIIIVCFCVSGKTMQLDLLQFNIVSFNIIMSELCTFLFFNNTNSCRFRALYLCCNKCVNGQYFNFILTGAWWSLFGKYISVHFISSNIFVNDIQLTIRHNIMVCCVSRYRKAYF